MLQTDKGHPFNRVAFVFLFAFVAAFPFLAMTFLFFKEPSFYDSQRVIVFILFFLINIFLLFDILFNGLALYERKLFVVFSGCFFWFVFVSLSSEFPLWSLIEIVIICSIFLAGMFFSRQFKKNDFRFLSYFVPLLIFVFSVYSTVLVVGFFNLAFNNGASDVQTWIFGFPNVRFLNQVQVFYVLVIVFSYFSLDRIFRCFALFSGITMFWSLTATGGRGAYLALVIGLFYGVLVLGYKKKYILIFFLMFAAGLLLSFFAFEFFLFDTEISRVITKGSSRRIDMWMEIIVRISDYFFVGVGGNHYSVFSELKLFAHPHNSFLMIAVEWGFLFAVVLTIILVLALLKVSRSEFLRKRNKEIAGSEFCPYKIFLIALVGLIVNSLFSGTFVTPLGGWAFSLALAGLFASVGKDESTLYQRLRQRDYFVVVGPILAVVFLTITIVFPQVYQVVVGESVYQEFPAFYAPRIWLDGAIR